MPQQLILASGSPRRKDLLCQLGLEFEAVAPEVSEDEIKGETNEGHVKRLAELKALSIAERYPEALVIGADTIVVSGSFRLGKPRSKEEARKMLERLSGQRHEVLTGVAVIGMAPGYREIAVERTTVWFKKLTSSQIERYLSTSEPYDKAGAYGIQGEASSFIEKVEGDMTNVIGLPLNKLRGLLEKAGFIFPSKSGQPDLIIPVD